MKYLGGAVKLSILLYPEPRVDDYRFWQFLSESLCPLLGLSIRFEGLSIGVYIRGWNGCRNTHFDTEIVKMRPYFVFLDEISGGRC